jgi:hypothetical protein
LGKRVHASRQASKSGPDSADATGNETSNVTTATAETTTFMRSAPARIA